MDREYFHQLLEERGLTRQEFEKNNGISTSTLTVALRGKMSPTLGKIREWTKCLHLDAEQVDRLFKITERYNNESD